MSQARIRQVEHVSSICRSICQFTGIYYQYHLSSFHTSNFLAAISHPPELETRECGMYEKSRLEAELDSNDVRKSGISQRSTQSLFSYDKVFFYCVISVRFKYDCCTSFSEKLRLETSIHLE